MSKQEEIKNKIKSKAADIKSTVRTKVATVVAGTMMLAGTATSCDNNNSKDEKQDTKTEYVVEILHDGTLAIVYEEVDLSGTDSIKIPNGLKCKNLYLGGATNFTLPQDLQVTHELNLDGTDGVKIPDGFKCKNLYLAYAKNVELGKNIQVDILDLREADDIKIADGFKCRYLGLLEAGNIELGKNMQVDKLDMEYTYGVKISERLKCKELNLRGAENFVIPASAEIGKIYGADESVVKKYRLEHAEYKAKQKARAKVAEIEQKINGTSSPNIPPMGFGNGNTGR